MESGSMIKAVSRTLALNSVGICLMLGFALVS